MPKIKKKKKIEQCTKFSFTETLRSFFPASRGLSGRERRERPLLAGKKLSEVKLDLANHLPRSSPCGLLIVSHRAFDNFKFYGESRGIFFFWSRFSEVWNLVSTNLNQIQGKQTILKDLGG